MKLPTRFENSGIVLIEIVTAFAILAILFSLGLPIAWNFYLDYQFDGEVNFLQSVLRKSRTLAMANVNESSHGVYFNADNFIVFQGASYASRVISQDRIFPRNTVVSVSGPAEIVFAALSGQTSSTTYTLTADAKSLDIFVNPEGLVYE